MLKKIRIKRFKKFNEVEINLKDFVVFIGENNSGKTSVLQAISLGLRLLSLTDLIIISNGKVKFRKRGVPFIQLPGFFYENPSDIFYCKIARGGKGGGVYPITLELIDEKNNIFCFEITSLFGAYAAKVNQKETKIIDPNIQLSTYTPLFISGFVGLLSSEERMFPKGIDDRLLKGRASEILRNLILDLKNKNFDRFEKLKSIIIKYFGINIGTVLFDDKNDQFIHAKYSETIQDKKFEFDLSSSGSGILQILQIITPIFLYLDTSKTILLDEPDAHLNPNLQDTLIKIIKQIIEEERIQILLSTHSITIIQGVNKENIIPVSNMYKSLIPMTNFEIETEREIIAHIDNSVFGKIASTGKILFIEDEITDILKKIDALLETNLFSGIKNIPVISSKGKDDKIPFRIKPILEQIISHPVEIFFIRDGDGMSEKNRSDLQELANNNIILYILPFHEIESYLINPDLFLSFNEINKHFNSESILSFFVSKMKDVILNKELHLFELLRDNIQKTERLLYENVNLKEVEKKVHQLLDEIKAYTSFDDLKRVIPAKETLSFIFKDLQDNYGININKKALISSLKIEHFDSEIIAFFKNNFNIQN